MGGFVVRVSDPFFEGWLARLFCLPPRDLLALDPGEKWLEGWNLAEGAKPGELDAMLELAIKGGNVVVERREELPYLRPGYRGPRHHPAGGGHSPTGEG